MPPNDLIALPLLVLAVAAACRTLVSYYERRRTLEREFRHTSTADLQNYLGHLYEHRPQGWITQCDLIAQILEERKTR